ncbi:hypothetical protein ACN47E_006217 [Coniothyrium glycines]
MLAQPPSQTQTAGPPRRTASEIDPHELSAALTSYLTHALAPPSYPQRGSSPTHACPHNSQAQYNAQNDDDEDGNMVVTSGDNDDDDDDDGGPLCREATIASWATAKDKLERKASRAGARRRRLEWFGWVRGKAR